MTIDHNEQESAPARRKDQHGQFVVWIVIGALAAYFGLFGLLIMDDLVFRGGLIMRPLRRARPDDAEQILEFVRLMYWPIIEGLKFLRIGRL